MIKVPLSFQVSLGTAFSLTNINEFTFFKRSLKLWFLGNKKDKQGSLCLQREFICFRGGGNRRKWEGKKKKEEKIIQTLQLLAE